jgi:predicted transcriptional regulator
MLIKEGKELIGNTMKRIGVSYVAWCMEKEKRDEIFRKIKEIDGVSTRQLARLTGISQSVISKA